MIKMTIYHTVTDSDHPVPETAHINLTYPLAGCVHVGRVWIVIDIETGLSYGGTSPTLKECGPCIMKLYDQVQELKRDQTRWYKWYGSRARAVNKMIMEENNTELYNHLYKYAEDAEWKR